MCDTTIFGMRFIASANSPGAPASGVENMSHVVRPIRNVPVSQIAPSLKPSAVTALAPERNAQPPPGVPPEPSGSSTTPSSVMN